MMKSHRKKKMAWLLALTMIAVVGITSFLFRGELRERYWLWRIEVGDHKEKLEILKNIGENGSVFFIPQVMELMVKSLKNQNWLIGFTVDSELQPFQGRKYLTEFQIIFTADLSYVPSDLNQYLENDYPELVAPSINVIKGIKSREPEKASEALRVYLKDSDDEKRWGAALSLFDTREKLELYLPKNKFLPKTTTRF